MFESILNNIAQNAPRPESEYLGEDGLLHCSVCHRATQAVVDIEALGIKKTVRCICDCVKKEREAFELKNILQERERRRNVCFSQSNMAQWTFANDDGKDAKLSEAMQNYVKNFTDFRKSGKGLLLYGTVGTGKTYYAACIANSLIDEGYKVLMTNFASLTNKIQGMFEGKQDFINDLNRYSLLILDDLGAERKSEFMQEMVFNIIDSRYRSGLPFIITTNLTMDEIKKPQDVGYSRIYDRILERCFPVEVTGNSRRRQNVRDTYFEVKEKLGL